MEVFTSYKDFQILTALTENDRWLWIVFKLESSKLVYLNGSAVCLGGVYVSEDEALNKAKDYLEFIYLPYACI